VVGYDPMAGKKVAAMRLPDLLVVFDPYDALAGAHAAVVVTEWEEFRNLDLECAGALMEAAKVLVDGRNFLDQESVRAAGSSYRNFGQV
jgi:UDPglucose 6-dehydrogenase